MSDYTTKDFFGLETMELPEGWQVIEGCYVVKCLDADGNVVAAQRMTKDITTWEALGLSVAMADGLRQSLRQDFQDEDPPEET